MTTMSGPVRSEVGTPETAPLDGYCPVFQHVMELLGRRWTGVILRVLLASPARFSDLRRAVPGLSDRLLAERLAELEFEGLVRRNVGDEAVSYELTEKGEDLRAALGAIASHGEKWACTAHLADRPGRRCPE
jgi:DNA-binding HxlR family transcriptional regulator